MAVAPTRLMSTPIASQVWVVTSPVINCRDRHVAEPSRVANAG